MNGLPSHYGRLDLIPDVQWVFDGTLLPFVIPFVQIARIKTFDIIDPSAGDLPTQLLFPMFQLCHGRSVAFGQIDCICDPASTDEQTAQRIVVSL